MSEDEQSTPDMTSRPAGQRFSRLWEDFSGRVLAYAIRHVGPDMAEEIVAETFLIAWRRLVDVPGDPLPWLLVVARNTIRSDRRSLYRARAVEQELARLQHLSNSDPATDVLVAERNAVLRALAGLSPRHREALLLIAWDGLTYQQAADVTDSSLSAFKVRVHRARDRLRRAADPPEEEPRSANRSSCAGLDAGDLIQRLTPEGPTP